MSILIMNKGNIYEMLCYCTCFSERYFTKVGKVNSHVIFSHT